MKLTRIVKIRVKCNLSRVNFCERYFRSCLLSGVLISAILIAMVS